jgi:hypothetical protein
LNSCTAALGILKNGDEIVNIRTQLYSFALTKNLSTRTGWPLWIYKGRFANIKLSWKPSDKVLLSDGIRWWLLPWTLITKVYVMEGCFRN